MKAPGNADSKASAERLDIRYRHEKSEDAFYDPFAALRFHLGRCAAVLSVFFLNSLCTLYISLLHVFKMILLLQELTLHEHTHKDDRNE